MQSISNISFLNLAEKITFHAYEGLKPHSTILAEVIGRVAAALFLSLGAALDIAFHTVCFLPSCLYALGKSIYLRQWEFSLPWEELQRIRNAVAPLILGSAFGLIHPYAGIAMSENTDKHAAIGMLAAHKKTNLHTPCSPIHSLEIIEDIAKAHPYDASKKKIFSNEHVNAIESARKYEKELESLQSQEFVHKLTNITLYTMAKIKIGVESSNLSQISKEIIVRAAGVLVPILTVLDLTITLFVQAFFLITGAIRWIANRGPAYTEVTTNPLMHVAFLIQNILKAVGNLFGTLVWFADPLTGFKVSLLPSNAFFKIQMNWLMFNLKRQMQSTIEGKRFAIPIAFFNGDNDVFSIPTNSMHKTYLIIEKKNDLFNLYWVNRPDVTVRRNVSLDESLNQIRSMLDERFPFMDIERMMAFPVKSKTPELKHGVLYKKIQDQGTNTNCVVSNLFGALEVLDDLNGKDKSVTQSRYETVRKSLSKDYGFYKNDFHPFTGDFSLNGTWDKIATKSAEAI